MNRTTSPKEGYTSPDQFNNPLNNPLGSKVDTAARGAHDTTDKIADAASSGIDRTREAVHRGVDSAANAAQSTAAYASSVIDQANQAQTQALEQACAAIRARPIATVVGALIAGYLLGRLARL
ncbi:MAG TPA: hypothetical protein VLQ46_00710 [Casimicrobiaceae bacterium]|nr:hypothetical protein [Casimicrobiaceae bacterium]